ncbi:MAG: hypothetical protein K6F52_00290 [Clostridia bacterium]|nr:hypothetical protein [Clostridia bacterium]
MKKIITLLLCLIIMFTFAGCGGDSSSRSGSQSAGVQDVLEEEMNKADGKTDSSESGRKSGINENAPKPEAINEDEVAAAGKNGIDIDLTALSSTMIYSEVYSMTFAPDDYIGKTVKMSGTFARFYEETTGKFYFACIISDATQCCSQGIEFVAKDKYEYPYDYPAEGEEICVKGVFDTYEENGYTYCTLRDAELL